MNSASTLTFNSKSYHLERYPATTDQSLRAWSNAEILALDYISQLDAGNCHLFNDRFGVWNCVLQEHNPTTIWTYASQKEAITRNLKRNNLSGNIKLKTSLDPLKQVDLALIKIPKSLELFELFLHQIHQAANENTQVVCTFMTKYFSPSFLSIASRYFDVAEQSRAWKKARLLILKAPKVAPEKRDFTTSFEHNDTLYQQYFGVFSSGKIDIGTRFFLEHLHVLPEEKKVLDLATGNGIIARELCNQYPNLALTVTDDFNLAIASARLNLPDSNTLFLCTENLKELSGNDYDLVVSNPPFHFEYENNIEITLDLFKGVYNCLKPGGRFTLVANSHLNYKTHLSKIFREVTQVAANKKFVVYSCSR